MNSLFAPCKATLLNETKQRNYVIIQLAYSTVSVIICEVTESYDACEMLCNQAAVEE